MLCVGEKNYRQAHKFRRGSSGSKFHMVIFGILFRKIKLFWINIQTSNNQNLLRQELQSLHKNCITVEIIVPWKVKNEELDNMFCFKQYYFL
ncbi:hypothetical protein C0J52_23498 [Blattella germanica]|nr:hypothetical protein C0J52_23498 [Blattella germanica]